MPRRKDEGFVEITLRDYFAGQALAGLCADAATLTAMTAMAADGVDDGPDSVAQTAYRLADAMLAGRNRNLTGPSEPQGDVRAGISGAEGPTDTPG